MKVAHASDLHGKYELLGAITDDVDVVLITGDFFPNKTRGHVRTEEGFQTRWFSYKRDALIRRLRGKPLLWMPGNHDYINLASRLKNYCDYPAYTIPVEGMDFMGKRWAGFREINRIEGEWNGEADLLTMVERCEELFANPFDILVTHAPPANILDGEEHDPGSHYGIGVLRSNLEYRPGHTVTHHFFGHCHHEGGKMVEEFGIKFYNGACHVKIVDLS